MTVQMPQDTVDSEVYIKDTQRPLCSQHGPLDFLHLEEALEQTPHPQQGDQGQTQ